MSSNMLPDIRKTVVIDAPIDQVWEKAATSEGIAAWFMPNTFRPELGCEFILHAGQFGDSTCKVTELDPPYRLGFDWDKDWHLTFELRALGDEKTEFTLIHSGWDQNKTVHFGQPHAVVREIMDGGWETKVKETLVAAVKEGPHARG